MTTLYKKLRFKDRKGEKIILDFIIINSKLYLAGYQAGYLVFGQAGYLAAGYPAKSVSGTTQIIA